MKPMTSAPESGRQPAQAVQYPLRLLFGSLILTATVLLALAWSATNSHRYAAAIAPRNLQLQELHDRIIYLDEVLTMSARLAAATGDPQWEQRYRRFAGQLEEAVAALGQLAADPVSAASTAQTAAANAQLVALENRAFALIRSQQVDEARRILFGAEYAAQKKTYAAGMDQLLRSIRDRLAASQQTQIRATLLATIGALVSILVLLFTGLSVWRRIMRWRAAQAAIIDRHATAEEFLHSLLANAPVNIFRKDAAGRFVYVNDRFCRAKGVTASQLLGQTASVINKPEAAQKASAEHEMIMRTGQSLELEESSLQPDGTVQHLHVVKSPVRAPDGSIIGTQGIQVDITAHKQAEARIRELSQAVEQSPVSIVITDLAGNIEYTNPRFSIVTGYSAAEALGRNPRILKSGETSPEEYQRLWRTITAGGTWRGEFHNRRKNGELYFEEAVISPIIDTNGRTTHYLAVKEDITARKAADQALHDAKLAAEAAAKAKSEFLANMSHEIRTPMNGVIGMTGLLLDTKLDPEQRQFAESVRNSADNLMVVINDILDFSKIEAGKLTFEELDFDLVETIEGSLDMLAERAQSKRIELLDAIAPDVPVHLCGDPGRLRQILTNLLGNALKFTEQGEVVLRVRLERETPTHAVLHFSVTDTGIGIPRQVQERLFQSFSQADTSTTRKYGGTGLGLAISKQLVSMMHGEIGVESEAGRGATFWFTAEFVKQTGAPRPARDQNQQLFNLRVLVVDDNATNRQILRHQIFAWKMQKGSAAGGHEALALLREGVAAGQPYDLALLDMQMPEMDGLSLARAIKSDPAIAATRLIMLTSLGHRFSKAELQAAGIDAYLVKPVKQSRLYDTLVDVMGDDYAQHALTEAPPAPAALPAGAPDGKSLRVLVAEDNQVNQKIAVAQLGKLGCLVDVVANGREVLECLPRLRYDLIFMDCQMPEMDGYEASQAIRRLEREPGRICAWKAPVRIVAMTANAMQGDREQCLAAGMDDYVSKPVRLADLQAALLRARG